MKKLQRAKPQDATLFKKELRICSVGNKGVLSACLASLIISGCGLVDPSDGGTAPPLAEASLSTLAPKDYSEKPVLSDMKDITEPTATSAPATAESGSLAAASTVLPKTSASVPSSINLVDTMVSDMKWFHDGPSAVLETIKGWGSGASFPEAKAREPSGWQYATPWTHTMADTNHVNGNGYPWRVASPYTGNQAPNTRVQQRDIQMWWLLDSGQWVLGSHNQSPGPNMYPLDWAEGTDINGTDIWRDETNNGGGASMRSIGRESYARHLWHTWASPHRIPVNAVGVATAYFSRLILDNPKGPDDRHLAHILSAGAGDYFRDQATISGFKVQGENVIYMGFARLKYVTKDWQLFSWTNLSEARIRANPPPFIGMPK